LRLIFAGTPEIAATLLSALLDTAHKIVAVYTQPDRQAGRGRRVIPSPVKTLAIRHGIAVEQPTTLKTETAQKILQQYQADAMIVVAYGLLLPKTVLTVPRYGCINVHVSLLPRWRGAAPIQHAILAGDRTTGVSIMQMDEGLDTGPIYQQIDCPILPTETSASLHDKLAQLAITPLLDTLTRLTNKQITTTPQADKHATYANKIHKHDACIDWGLSAHTIERMIRAYLPWPIAYFAHHNDTVRVLSANSVMTDTLVTPGTILRYDKQGLIVQTGQGALSIQQLQLPGKRSQPINDIVNGYPQYFTVGSIL